VKSSRPQQGFGWRRRYSRAAGFTLIELLTAAVVFVILGVLIAQLLSSATLITGLSNKKQVADAQARMIFSRMALDFGRMLKRSDVEYYLQRQSGNDRLAFLSEVSGYYPSTATPGTLSVVSYRMGQTPGEFKGLERYGKGLSWLADASGETPAIYRNAISTFAPDAVGSAASSEYEEIGPGVIRFEYFYLLKNGQLSEVPWDVSAGHSNVNGFKDVTAICVVMAVIDPSVIGRVTPSDVQALAAKLPDFSASTMPTLRGVEKAWQEVIDSDDFTRKSGGAVRVHARCFPLNS
jgi:type II secretory pathway pseudopilin PulG